MGTLFAGIVRAPMTSVFMIFEITQDYQILVPLMVANMLSFVISRRYQPVPVYHALLHQDGVHLPSPATQPANSSRTARHVMRTDVAFIAPDTSVANAWRWVNDHPAPAYLVGTRDELAGVVTRDQLEHWQASAQADEPIGSVVEPSFAHAHPDHPLDLVIERLSDSHGILPVVSRAEARRVEGVVTGESILAAAGGRSRTRPARSAH
jgi:CIC family chloride channel protein